MTPAFAITMSRRPNSASPSATDLLDGIGVADVGLAGDDTSAFLLDELGGLVEVLGARVGIVDGVDVAADVERDDVRPVRREPDRMRAALASRRSGDEGDFAVQISHGFRSSCLSRQRTAGMNPCFPQAFLRIIDFDVPVAA